MKEEAMIRKPQKFTQAEFDAARVAARQVIDETGYGHWVSDAKVATVVEKVLGAIEAYRMELHDDDEKEDT